MNFIVELKERKATFYQLWDKEVAPFIKKEKYVFCHGNDVFFKNFTKEDDKVINDFFNKYNPLFKKCFSKDINTEYSNYEEILYKHVFDY